jgi:hypothetical protein
MSTSRGQVGVWLFFSFLVLGIAVVLLFIFLNGREPVKPEPVLNVSNVTYYNVSIVLVNVSGSVPVSYTLTNITWDVKGGFTGENCIDVSKLYLQGYIVNGSDINGCPLVGKWIKGKVFVKGLVFPDKLEFYRGGVVANSTVLLEGFSDLYYFNSTICNISRELYPCKLSLLKKANDFSINFTKTSLIINASDGTLQKPIICFQHNYALSNIVTNLSSIKVPDDLHWKYDLCYNVTRDLKGLNKFPISLHYNEFFNTSMNASVLVRDWELSPYKNLGDRIVELYNR